MASLPPHETDILFKAKTANAWWYRAVIRAAEIMADRRKKYSGEEDPYFNFVDMFRRRENRTMLDIFLFYLDIKRSRLEATQTDFADESVLDTLTDMLNYAALALGWFLGERKPEDVIPPEVNPYEGLWPILCLDLDGVLNQYRGWTGQYEQYEPYPKVEEFLKALKAKGYTLIVCTARPDDQMVDVWAWLEKHKLDGYIYDVTNKKPPAVAYPDDRGINFDGDYDKLLAELDGFKAYWQEDGQRG